MLIRNLRDHHPLSVLSVEFHASDDNENLAGLTTAK
jgi:hypothetical protein